VVTPVMIGPDDEVPDGYTLIGEDDRGKYMLPTWMLDEQGNIRPEVYEVYEDGLMLDETGEEG
jgi:hypothetical protein